MTDRLALLEAPVLIVLGLLALVVGRRWLWLLAGIVGFALGWWLMDLAKLGELRLVAGILIGLIAIGSLRFLGKWARHTVAAVAGFVTVPMLLGSLGMLGGIPEFIWAVFGAIVLILCAMYRIDWALIFLAAILGTGLILNGAQVFLDAARLGGLLSAASRMIVGFVLILAGVYVQAQQKN